MENQLNLPARLKPYQDKFERSLRPYVKILPQAEGEARLWESKIGGLPYLPAETEWPKGANGEPLFLLAQINFGEMPSLEPFPDRGLLQFYISAGGMHGLDLKRPDNPAGFRVLFFEDIDEGTPPLIPESEVQVEDLFLPFDPTHSFPLKFELHHEVVPLSDHHILNFLSANFFARFGNERWEVMEAYSRKVNSSGHKIGGYSFFTQEDPRPDLIGQAVQLLQIDSDKTIHSMWGDMGTAHFFIHNEDLEKRDFSKVAYWWDGY